jgi:hypothetical protein
MRPQCMKKLCSVRLLTVGVSLLSLALTGCGGGNSNSSGNEAPAAPLSLSATASDGLTATFSENTSTVIAGGSVTYTLTLTNNTNQPITYETGVDLLGTVGGEIYIDNSSGQVYPVCLVTPADDPIPVYFITTLTPGQSSSTTTTPKFNFTPAGVYTAEADFDISNMTGDVFTEQAVAVRPLKVTAHAL